MSEESWKRSYWKFSKKYPLSNSGQILKHTKYFKLFMERTIYLVHVSFNGIQDSEWGTRTVTSWNGNLRLSKNLNWQRINCTLIKIKLIWFFIRIGERRRFGSNVFHAVSQVSKRAQSQPVKAPDRPVRPTHIVCYSIMESSFGCFNMILKKITV